MPVVERPKLGATAPSQPSPMSNANAACILVIDDEPQIRKFLRISLNAGGYRVVEAGSGEEGLAQAALNRPDLVVLAAYEPRALVGGQERRQPAGVRRHGDEPDVDHAYVAATGSRTNTGISRSVAAAW